MTLLQKLKDQGWHLTEDGLKKLTSDLQTEDVKKIIASALDWDIKEFGGGALPSKPESNGNIAGRIVLQMQKMRNISAPKANEESTDGPRFLQLELSDGLNTIPALELERIPNLNLNVPPGTKFYFKSEKLQMMQGFLVLKASDVQILGGRVENMVEKWEVARQLLKYARSNRRLSGIGAPPPWIAFEKRMNAHKESLPLDRNFKSLQAAADKDKNSKENDEFNAARSQAIADAAKSGKRRVFGGGQQNMLDHNVKKILEKGYLEEDATYALKTTNNNLERALFSLKKRNNRVSTEGNAKPAPMGAAEVRGGPRGRAAATSKEEASASKPQANVSLFEFLTVKIPQAAASSNTNQPPAPTQSAVNNNIQTTTKNARETRNPFSTNNTTTSSSSNNNNNNSKDLKALGKFENNMSSSFAANRVSHNPRSDLQPSSNYPQSQRSNYNQREERTRANPTNNKQNQRGGGDRSRINNEKPTTTQTQTLANDSGASQVVGSNSNTNNNNNTNINSSAQSSAYNSNSNKRNERNDRAPRKDREQTPRQSMGSGAGGYQGNKRNADFKPNENKSYQQRDNNSRGNNDAKNSNSYQQAPHQPKTNNIDNTMDKLTESTAKMSLQNKKEPYNNSQSRGRHQGGSSRTSNQNATQTKSSNSQQQQTSQFISSQNFTNKSQAASKQMTANVTSPQQQQQQQQPSHTFVTQIPNGFSYDPSKIIGFQSKEANEYAMNLLKSQGLLPQQPTGPTAQQTTLPPPAHQAQILNNPQAAPPTAVAYMPQNPNVFVAAQQAPMAQYGMMAGGSWPWNVGDLCLAKYWEDGDYYEAKITGISENTCVVFFMGYGNFEEVLKSECLPITDGAHHSLNTFQAGPPPPGPMQQQLAHTYQGANTAGGGGGSGNQRYRTERQMYVPPPKRGNNQNNN